MPTQPYQPEHPNTVPMPGDSETMTIEANTSPLRIGLDAPSLATPEELAVLPFHGDESIVVSAPARITTPDGQSHWVVVVAPKDSANSSLPWANTTRTDTRSGEANEQVVSRYQVFLVEAKPLSPDSGQEDKPAVARVGAQRATKIRVEEVNDEPDVDHEVRLLVVPGGREGEIQISNRTAGAIDVSVVPKQESSAEATQTDVPLGAQAAASIALMASAAPETSASDSKAVPASKETIAASPEVTAETVAGQLEAASKTESGLHEVVAGLVNNGHAEALADAITQLGDKVDVMPIVDTLLRAGREEVILDHLAHWQKAGIKINSATIISRFVNQGQAQTLLNSMAKLEAARIDRSVVAQGILERKGPDLLLDKLNLFNTATRSAIANTLLSGYRYRDVLHYLRELSADGNDEYVIGMLVDHGYEESIKANYPDIARLSHLRYVFAKS